MLRVALKDALAHRLRLVATGTGILLGVAFLAGSFVLTDTIRRTFDDLFSEVNAGRDAVVRQAFEVEGGFQGQARGRVPARLLATVGGVDGVADVEGVVGGFAQIVGEDGEPLGEPGQGPPTIGVSWPARADLNPLVLAEGRAPAGPREVVIDRNSAERGDLAVGDRVTVLTKAGPVRCELVGIARFGDADSPGGASVAAFATPTAQRVLGQPGYYDSIAVVADEGVGEDEIVRRLSAVLPDGIEAVSGDAFTEDQQQEINEGVDFFETFLLAFAGVGLFVGGFAIFNTFSIIGAQRVRETALLRAVGASRRQVLVALLVEALVLGVVATGLGIAAGFLIAAGLKALLAGLGVDIPAAGLVFRARTAVWAAVVGIGVTVVSALAPAWRASRVPPVAAIRGVAVDETGRSRARLLVGGGILAAGAALLAGGMTGNSLGTVGAGGAVTFVGLAVLGGYLVRPVGGALSAALPRARGIVGTLARHNLMRNPRRTASTAAALMIGAAVVVSITVMAASIRASMGETIDATVRADVVIDSTSQGSGIATALGERLERLGTVVPVRHALVEVDGKADMLAAFPVALAPEAIDAGVDDDALRRLGPAEIAVHEDTAESRGLEVGDTVTVTFPDTGERRFRVGLVHTEGFVAGTYFVDLATFAANVVDEFDLRVFVAGADAEAVERVAAAFPNAEVRDVAGFKADQEDELEGLLGLVYSLLALAVVIALFGIGNALSLAILERTRELGLLRAVGMTRRQLRSAVRWESILIAVFGTALGIAVGLLFAWALTVVDDDLVFRVPVGQLALIAVAAVVAGVVAALGPTRRAARLDVLEAVTHE